MLENGLTGVACAVVPVSDGDGYMHPSKRWRFGMSVSARSIFENKCNAWANRIDSTEVRRIRWTFEISGGHCTKYNSQRTLQDREINYYTIILVHIM